MAFGPQGDLYVSSRNTFSVLRYNGATGAFIDEFVQFGSGGLSGPNGLTFGPDLDLYVASGFSNEVLLLCVHHDDNRCGVRQIGMPGMTNESASTGSQRPYLRSKNAASGHCGL